MVNEEYKNLMPMAELMLSSIFRLSSMLKLYEPNNSLVVTTLDEFKKGYDGISAKMDSVSISIYRGRFFFNEDRISQSDTLTAIAPKLIDFLQSINVHGLKFSAKSDLGTKEIIQAANLLNAAHDQKEDRFAWIKGQLEAAGINWLEPMSEGSFKKPNRDGLMGTANQIYNQAMAVKARKSYGHALSSLVEMGQKITSGNRIGVQKPKRVIQDMIELLLQDDSILLAMSTVREYDDYTFTHSINVAILAMCLAKRLGLSRIFIEQVGLCGLFHDLGKVEIPLELINKRERLTDNEFELIKEHSLNSVRQIISMNADHGLKSRLLLAPFEHHLGVDLSGYPRTGRQAPVSLIGRILTVADVYDAMTSGRVYRPEGIRPDQALKIMVGEAGTKLDPLILKVFIDMIGIYPVGSLVVMDTKEVGLVMESPLGSELGRPLVRLLDLGEDGQPEKGPFLDMSARDENTGQYLRNIVRCLNPSEYGIQPVFFMD